MLVVLLQNRCDCRITDTELAHFNPYRPTKRSLALQQVGRDSVKAKKLKRTLEESKEAGEIPDIASSDGALSTDSNKS